MVLEPVSPFLSFIAMDLPLSPGALANASGGNGPIELIFGTAVSVPCIAPPPFSPSSPRLRGSATPLKSGTVSSVICLSTSAASGICISTADFFSSSLTTVALPFAALPQNPLIFLNLENN
ncbi:hypothetical protein L1887_31459 [Cichorium endivia]|nr:hypothetical protein L1887_31459 [Cichorium endivia]